MAGVPVPGQFVAYAWEVITRISAKQRRLATFNDVGFPMKNFVRAVKQFLNDESGPTAVEYAVMLALIVIVCLVSIRTLGTNTNTSFNNMANSMKK